MRRFKSKDKKDFYGVTEANIPGGITLISRPPYLGRFEKTDEPSFVVNKLGVEYVDTEVGSEYITKKIIINILRI